MLLNDDEGRDKNGKLAVVSKQHPPKSVICLGDIGNVMLSSTKLSRLGSGRHEESL